MIERSRVQLPVIALSGNDSGQVVHTHVLCHQAVQFGTGQRAVMLCGQEDNQGLASHWPCGTDFSGLSTYGLNGHREGDEHPTYAPNWSMVHFIFFTPIIQYHICSIILLSVNVTRMWFDGIRQWTMLKDYGEVK